MAAGGLAYEVVRMDPPRKGRARARARECDLPIESIEVGHAIICHGEMRTLANLALQRGLQLDRTFAVRTLHDGRVGIFRTA